MLALGEIVEIDLIDLIHDLPHQLARLHVIVSVLEHILDHAATVAGLGRYRKVAVGGNGQPRVRDDPEMVIFNPDTGARGLDNRAVVKILVRWLVKNRRRCY